MSSAKIEKRTGTHVETILFTRDELVAWRLPDFQREVNANPKVQALKEDLKKNGGILPGMITFGEVDGIRYLIDGQQRREGFLLSELLEGYADTRVCYFDTMAEMAREYVRLNSHLVNMKPDAILRGLEPCLPALAKRREHCGFIGYGNIRRGARSPILSMSAVIRSWAGSSPECPCGGGKSSQTLAEEMTMEDVTLLSTCLKLMHKAWGREPEYLRLWSSINLTLCLWLYRRVVVTQYSGKSERLDKDQFE